MPSPENSLIFTHHHAIALQCQWQHDDACSYTGSGNYRSSQDQHLFESGSQAGTTLPRAALPY